MSVLVIGATGFIGPRVIRRLVARGEKVVGMDLNPGAAPFAGVPIGAPVVRGDITQFEDVMRTVLDVKPERLINLAYGLGAGEGNPHQVMRLDILGMDNCFEAARLANVTGPDKVRGSVDHVQIMVDAARGRPVHLPNKGMMRLLIHVEDIAEVFARVLLADTPRHSLYNSGGMPASLGELADIVRGFIPDARITFANEGGREESGNYLVDWSRLAKEFGVEYPGLHTRVLEVINEVRQQEGLPLVGGR